MLSPAQVRSLSRTLFPKSAVAVDGSLRRLAGYVNLELQTPKDERFHRVYKGSHPARRDRVVLHLYDLSASDDSNAKARARREAEALQRLQLHPWAPRILDSWQDAPGYAGEMFFFTVVDPAAPSIEDRATDESWTTFSRLQFAREAMGALSQMHQSGGSDEPLVHRNLTPQSILVRHDNSPIFTGFDRTRIPSETSVASSTPPASDYPQTVAPEVQAQGLAAADQRSDVYSLCACLSGLFAGRTDGVSCGAIEVLATGLAEAPGDRSLLADMEKALSGLLGDSVPLPPAPPARFWTEDQTVRSHGHSYRIVTRLGSGGIGTTFKVVELDQSTKEELGTYVAKVAHERETGQCVLKAYSLARSHLGRHEALSPIFEVAREWQENEFVSLLGWIDGTPLSEFTGVFPLLAEDQGEPSAETLAIRWLQLSCEALDVLHRNGLTHGDVSPRRGKGKFLETFGGEAGTMREKKRAATIDRVASTLAQNDRFAGFDDEHDETGRAILGDLLLSFCLENANKALGRKEPVLRVAPAHYMASWVDLPQSVAHLRYVPEMIVAMLADQKNDCVEQNHDGDRTWFKVGRGFEDNVLLRVFHKGVIREGELANRTADKFDETAKVGLDQLLMIRLAQQLGQAPDKLRGKASGGDKISNQRPIAERAARQFSEDIRHFIVGYADVAPRHTFVEMLESCMAIGLTTILTSVIELLVEWVDTGEIRKKCDQYPTPLLVDCSNGVDRSLRAVAEQSMDDFLRRMERFPVILMALRLLDHGARYDPKLRKLDIPTRPYATEWLNLLGDLLHERREEAGAVLYDLERKAYELGDALEHDYPEATHLLRNNQSYANPV